MNSPQTAPRARVTTSWDDGHALDLRLADLLDAYAVPGTFYVAPRNVEFPRSALLTDADIRELGARHELGGHTLEHVRLTARTDATAAADILAGKHYLEDVGQAQVVCFCYPGGAYAVRHIDMVARAGFSVARTIERWSTAGGPALEMPTTVHAFRHLVDVVPVLRLARGRPDRAATFYQHWDRVAITLFDRVLSNGGTFHLWGHSWEVDARGDWQRLERVLAHIGGRGHVEYLTNGELVRSQGGGA